MTVPGTEVLEGVVLGTNLLARVSVVKVITVAPVQYSTGGLAAAAAENLQSVKPGFLVAVTDTGETVEPVWLLLLAGRRLLEAAAAADNITMGGHLVQEASAEGEMDNPQAPVMPVIQIRAEAEEQAGPGRMAAVQAL